MAKRVSFEDDDFQENYGYLSTTTPTPEDSSEEDAAIGIGNEDSEEEVDTDHEDQENRASTINYDKNCGTICTDDHPEEHTDNELELIENAFEYLVKKKYPTSCSKNQKSNTKKSRETSGTKWRNILQETRRKYGKSTQCTNPLSITLSACIAKTCQYTQLGTVGFFKNSNTT